MRLFVTGASGHIGSALVPDLLAAGHTVVGLARSDASAAALATAGAEIRRGTLDDLGGLREGVADNPSSNVATRTLLKWETTHPGLLADLAETHYFA